MPALRHAARSRGPLLSADELNQLLTDGELVVEGRLVDASNATLFCRLGGPEGPATIYKPIAGERPLWDFPDGTLAAREVATYLISEALGFGLVPPTILRDGPFGPGMVQLWIDTDPTVELVQVMRDEDGDIRLTHADHPRLREMTLFDIIINNADRKGSHVLAALDGAVYGVDHGVSLHETTKLRTVLWGWAGERLLSSEVATLEAAIIGLGSDMAVALAPLLSAAEIFSIEDRCSRLLRTGKLPRPPRDGPALPWPPV